MSEAWRSLQSLLLDTARQRGSAPAIVSPTETLSYAELFGRAYALSRRLEPARSGLVLLALPKSSELVTAWLACWFAGTAFSTLDPSLPRERANGILKRLEPRFVLRAESGASGEGAELAGCEQVWVGALSSSAQADSQQLDWQQLDDAAMKQPNDLAYVCWTSGSSGEPKGALLEHRGLPHVIRDQVSAFELDSSARCLWLLRPAFDASLSDVFTCLLAGGALHLAPELETGFTPQKLLETLQSRRITHIDLPPSLLTRIPTDQLPASLRCVVIGGEAPDLSAAAEWSRRVRLVNVYGPTECSICTSLLVWSPDFDAPYIGQPLSAVRYRVGVHDAARGELLIGGEQLARGYWQAPELDSDRFTLLDSERWYRTGDRVERRAYGLCFAGRIDRQFKWRGQLVAPEEVEAELVASGACERAHVTLHRDRFVAVIQAAPEVEGSLRRHLSQRLPRWMCPTTYVFKECLPETPTGKLDVGAIWAMLATPPVLIESPRRLTEVVRRQLGKVDSSLSYFAQGGDSLGVLEVLSACEELGYQFTPEQLASDRSLAELEMADSADCPEASAEYLAKDARSCLPRVTSVDPQGYRSAAHTLITGATGFLGSRCLLELLSQEPDREYVALIRARDPEHARQRLVEACDAHVPGALERLAGNRVRCIVGEISRPELGLSPEDYTWLAQHTEQVVHSAARVNLVLPYAVHRPSNLVGTAEILRLCRLANVRQLHYASTLSVFSATDRCPTECTEAHALDPAAQISGGYAQSKWAAERLLEFAQPHVPNVSVARFGLITGDSQSAYAPADDWLTRITRALAELGYAPDAPLAFDLTPVDYAAKAWATLILRSTPRGLKRYHVSNTSVSLERWLKALGNIGASIEPLSEQRFAEYVSEHSRDTTHAVHLSLATTRSLDAKRLDARRGLDVFQATGVHFDCEQAEQILADWGVRPPGAPQTLLTRYAARMLNIAPSSGSSRAASAQEPGHG